MARADAGELGQMAMFCQAAEKSSFTEAARHLGTTPSAISKAIARLEARLGAQLFQRSTRSIRLTDDGQAYYEVCRDALGRIEKAEARLRRGPQASMGTLRLSLPLSYGIKRVIPLLPRYLDQHRGRVTVVVSLTNSVTNFIDEAFDLSVRLGPLADSRHVARALHAAQFRVVASPCYLSAHGVPAQPGDLRDHRCIDLVLPDTGRSLPWQFQVQGQREEATPGFVLTLDHPLAASTAARHGAGIARLLDFTVEEELRAGTLVEVLAEFRAPPQAVSAVYPSGRHLPEKVRTFLDFLVSEAGPTRS